MIDNDDEVVFRSTYTRYLLAMSCFLFVGGACIAFMRHMGQSVWIWMGVASCLVIWGLTLIRHYANHVLILRNYELVFRSGVISMHEVSLPLWDVRLIVLQDLLGRIFDYGTVVQCVSNEAIVMYDIAQIRALRTLIADRKAHLLTML